MTEQTTTETIAQHTETAESTPATTKPKAAKRERKKSPLALHHDGECGCSRTSNPQECIYQEFLDGWSFTPDVGNGQKRGEVFTPRFVVDKMTTDVGLFPREGVYDLNYSVSTEEAKSIVAKRVIEPAVGTANYLSSILWHKLEYAYVAALDSTGELDLDIYHEQLLIAVGSVYAYDIDVGNLEVTRRRLLAQNAPLNAKRTVNAWNTEFKKAMHTETDISALIATIVDESLASAVEHWEQFFDDAQGGVLQQLYRKHTGEELPDFLKKHCEKMLKSNIKLLNGIEKDDKVTDDFAVPGWYNVHWDWWTVIPAEDGDFKLRRKRVSMAQQKLIGELEQLEEQSKRLEAKKTVDPNSNALFAVPTWANEQDKAEHAKIEKQINKLMKEIAELRGK